MSRLHLGGLVMAVCVISLGAGLTCPTEPSDVAGEFNNTTDPTNKSAKYLGSDACRACHPTIDVQQIVHGHAHKLNPVQGAPPTYPSQGTRAGVPNPPEGKTWDDVIYIIGGYIRKARFIDVNGYIMTNDADGVDPQWNLQFGANGLETGFVHYEDSGKFSPENPKPYNQSCFVCHTTGSVAPSEDNPEFQENRPGFAGTWEEPGVQCEACHGPGSNHVPNPAARDIFVDTSSSQCGGCHTRPFGSDGSVILAKGGFVRHHEQYPELLASGGHSTLDCVTCHDPHVSTNYDRENAIRNECVACHSDQTAALHNGKVFVRGDYTETLSCESCHMPYATKSAAAATTEIAGELGRIGDMRTHIFRINTSAVDYTAMFTDDLGEVAKDADGAAAVTVDFVCLRCHNGIGNAFELTIESASAIATEMHDAGS